MWSDSLIKPSQTYPVAQDFFVCKKNTWIFFFPVSNWFLNICKPLAPAISYVNEFQNLIMPCVKSSSGVLNTLNYFILFHASNSTTVIKSKHWVHLHHVWVCHQPWWDRALSCSPARMKTLIHSLCRCDSNPWSTFPTSLSTLSAERKGTGTQERYTRALFPGLFCVLSIKLLFLALLYRNFQQTDHSGSEISFLSIDN